MSKELERFDALNAVEKAGNLAYKGPMQEFIEKIIKTLESNGFPSKKVSLPTEKMYEAADNLNLSFNKVLEELKGRRQIIGEVGTEKIVFSKEAAQMDQADMFKKAQEMMSQMGPDELKKMQEMVENMSDEEKEEMMKNAKGMGLF